MKILIVSHGVINDENGVGRVHYHLMSEYRKAGHHVDKIDYLDLYPKKQTHFSRIFGKSMGEKAFSVLKAKAFGYDVIDANSECIIYPKYAFGFKGLLFLRSHGARPLGKNAELIEKVASAFKMEKVERSFKTRVGSLIRSFYKKSTIQQFYLSLKYADLVHCLNEAEYNFFVNLGVPKPRLLWIPNGLPAETLKQFESAGENRRYNSNLACFVAAWRIMKGVKDWREISILLTGIKNFRQILLLGTSWNEELVKKDFESKILPFVKIVTHFKPDQLPTLLASCKVGIFTSYTEGFPYAVLEQIATGIPVIAYRVSGVTDLLTRIDPSLLIEPGNIPLLVEKVKHILEMNIDEYGALSKKCIVVSKRYTLENLSPLYLRSFQRFSN